MNKIATFSFDDGGPADTKSIEFCLQAGLVPTFYLVSTLLNMEHMVYAMDRKELRRAYRDVEVGSHTATHPHLSLLDETATRYELASSKQVLEDLMERPVTLFAHPYGSSGPYTERLLAETGYEWARRIHRAYDVPHTTKFAMPITSMLFSPQEEQGLLHRLGQDQPVHVLCHSYFIERAGWWHILGQWLDLIKDAGYELLPNSTYFERTYSP